MKTVFCYLHYLEALPVNDCNNLKHKKSTIFAFEILIEHKALNSFLNIVYHTVVGINSMLKKSWVKMKKNLLVQKFQPVVIYFCC